MAVTAIGVCRDPGRDGRIEQGSIRVKRLRRACALLPAFGQRGSGQQGIERAHGGMGKDRLAPGNIFDKCRYCRAPLVQKPFNSHQ